MMQIPLYQSDNKGFTLIEVMVSLAILAVVAVAAYQASAGYLNSISGMKTRTLAHFVAQNAGVKLQMEQAWLLANRQEQISSQGRQWQVTYRPKTLQQIPDQSVQSVSINVVEVLDDNKTGVGTDIIIMLTNPTPN